MMVMFDMWKITMSMSRLVQWSWRVCNDWCVHMLLNENWTIHMFFYVLCLHNWYFNMDWVGLRYWSINYKDTGNIYIFCCCWLDRVIVLWKISFEMIEKYEVSEFTWNVLFDEFGFDNWVWLWNRLWICKLVQISINVE